MQEFVLTIETATTRPYAVVSAALKSSADFKLETPVLLPPNMTKASETAPSPAKAEKAGKTGKEKKEKKKSDEAANQE